MKSDSIMKGVFVLLCISGVCGGLLLAMLAQAQNPNRPEHVSDDVVCINAGAEVPHN